ncbi:hypothetical protein ACFVZW_08335 [Streptomyces sp. NPDC059567]|uniref:hypothetical protein n=1 Tax=Streptomyces sp. NPDC059567 TaxID=3346867 RepID=UPI0036BC0BD2
MVYRDEYDLTIDTQAEKLIDLKQKLVYFLATAATALVVFSSKFALDYGKEFNREAVNPGGTVRWLVGAAFFALLTVGFALMGVFLGHKSFERHLEFRYKKALPNDEESKRWSLLTSFQQWMFYCSSAFLITSTALAFCYFSFLLW